MGDKDRKDKWTTRTYGSDEDKDPGQDQELRQQPSKDLVGGARDSQRSLTCWELGREGHWGAPNPGS